MHNGMCIDEYVGGGLAGMAMWIPRSIIYKV